MEKKRPLILLTNDDGIDALGLKCLWEVLRDIGDVIIVAPSHEQSGKGLSLTAPTPLKIQKLEWKEETPCWSVSGTPAECVKIALSILIETPPDLICSGINKGSNAGRNTLYSGTVGATIEGAFRGIPGLALSCECYIDPNYDVAQKYIPHLVRYVMEHPLPLGSVWNVNFPKVDQSEIKGVRIARQGQGYWVEDPYTHEDHSEELPVYNLGIKYFDTDDHHHCDTILLKQGYITAVPIHVGELTDHNEFHKRQDHDLNFFD